MKKKMTQLNYCNVMAKGFRFMPFEFSKAENLSAQHMG